MDKNSPDSVVPTLKKSNQDNCPKPGAAINEQYAKSGKDPKVTPSSNENLGEKISKQNMKPAPVPNGVPGEKSGV